MTVPHNDGSSSPVSEDWIELHNVRAPIPSASRSRSDSDGNQQNLPIRDGSPVSRRPNRPPLPNLRIDTSQLDPPGDDQETHEAPAPQSAILGLAKGSNLVIDNWLSESKSNEPDKSDKISPLSPARSIRSRRRPSNHSSSSRSPDASPTLGPHSTRSRRRLSSLGQSRVRKNSKSSDDGDAEEPTTPIPKLTLTVERSFQRRGQETPLFSDDQSINASDNVFDDSNELEDDYEEVMSKKKDVAVTEEENDSEEDPLSVLKPRSKNSDQYLNAPSDSKHPNLAATRTNKSADSLNPSIATASTDNTRSASGAGSKLSPTRPAPHNLSLSGAAYAAQQDFLDAEEQGRGVDDSGVKESDLDEDILSGSSMLDESIVGDASSENILDDDMNDERKLKNRLSEPMGRTLFYFESTSGFRRLAFRVVSAEFTRYSEIILTIVQVAVICAEVWGPFSTSDGVPSVLNPQLLWAYCGLYVVFTTLFFFRCVAYGVFTNQILTKTRLKQLATLAFRTILHLASLGSIKAPQDTHTSNRSPYSHYKCTLRKSWGRVDFISIIFFWAMVGVSVRPEIDSLDLIVAGLGQLRILRLLEEITYTRIVLEVLKTAIPFLQNVLIFIGFFLSIWGVTGLQSFNGSLRRVCIHDQIITSQNCGSWQHPDTREIMPYMLLDSSRGTYQNQSTSKGYTCPVGSQCVELRAFPPYGSLSSMANQSFDNFFNALEIVFIMMSNNGFTPIMYDIIDSEYLASSLFFVTGVLFLGIWMMNLLVAVMVSSYASVRHKFEITLEDSTLVQMRRKVWDLTIGKFSSKIRNKNSSSSRSLGSSQSNDSYSHPQSSLNEPSEPDPEVQSETFREKRDHGNWIVQNTVWGKRYGLIYPLFAVLAVVDLAVQASKTSPTENLFGWELGLAIAFGVDIVLRFWVFLPYWRYFFFSFTNLMDLGLAVANCVILAFYDEEEVYSWLTAFQLLRVYRMVGAFKYSRVFWLQVFGNFKALASLTAFFFLCTFFCTLIAVKMLRGQFPMESDDGINTYSFYDLAIGFFSMYMVASTENWTDVLFWVIDNVSRPGDNVVGLACMGIMFCGWLFFANFLIFNLFVGIMSESLHGAISNKREEQVRQFFEELKESNFNQQGPLFGNVFSGIGSSSEEDGDLVEQPVSRPVKFREKVIAQIMRWMGQSEDPRVFSGPMRSAIERQFVIEFLEAHGGAEQFTGGKVHSGKTFLSLQTDDTNILGFTDYSNFSIFKKLKKGLWKVYSCFHHYPEDYRQFLYQRFETFGAGAENSHRAYVEGMFDQNTHTLAILEDYCKEHPRFDTPLFIFGGGNKLRQFCQRLVPPSRGSRLSKIYPKKWVGIYVRIFFLAATVAIVVQTCINTPLSSLDDESQQSHPVWTYSRIVDLVYGIIFTIEFLVKVIADGFHFTPNAYTRSVWNCLDFIVLISIWMTFINDLANGVLSRYLRALLALRALRLISFFRNSELLLSSVFTYGLRNVLGATFITLSIVVPYSVWGKNIFHNRLTQCNDDNTNYLSNCTGEYLSEVFDNFQVLAPRVVQENYFNYNNFWEALLIQFGVLSLEGWVDVLQAVTAITEKNQQPSTNASTGNGAYPILYHYIGAVLIMTMLIAVIIRNYAITVGTAFLTEQQLSWLDVKRTLKLLKPTPKPPHYREGTVRHSLLCIMPTWITSIELWALFVATVDMAAYFYPLKRSTQHVYELILVACSTLMFLLSVLRLIVLKSTLYLHNWWNPFGLIVCLAVTVLSCVNIMLPDYKLAGALAANRAADICMLLLWVPRTKKLYQFYTISTAAIKEISVLLRAWLTLFITYAIACNQSFGLAKLGSHSTWSRNFRTIPKALIALFTMSCGENWNEFLIDFTLSKPYCREDSNQSECGIPGFAYFLFISWNVLSMYVFANLFISLVCEACWYLYRSSAVNISERDIICLLDSWQQFDPRGTGYIRTKDLFRFLGRTQGYFSMSIYSQDPKYNVHRIIEETQSDARTVVDPYNVDMDSINRYLADMPVTQYRERRVLFEMFTTQAQLMSYAIPGGRGMRFPKLTLLFPLYKDMNPSETLTLKEFIILKVQLYEARVTLAADFIIRTWRLKQQKEKYSHHDREESPGVGYDQSWTHKTGNSVYWVS